jgi:YesN/AraC family two-component response regulator
MLLYDAWFPTRRTKGEDDCGARRRRALMLRARAYLERHYAEPLSLETIAQALRVSPYYLSHVFSAENEFSLSQYLISWRMEKAHELLVKGTHNVTEAARAVGYQDGDYFAKAFMRHFGRPPRAVRE